jgi:hypothetical protein
MEKNAKIVRRLAKATEWDEVGESQGYHGVIAEEPREDKRKTGRGL